MEQTDGRDKRHARPNIHVSLPTLSPPFINADDAARFAHQLIGDYRSVEYGGAILTDAEGRYFATRPVRGKTDSFDPTLVISTNSAGEFISPPGYACAALYHSHPADYDRLKSGFKHWSPEDIYTSINAFSSTDMVLNRLNANFAPAHYLSGVNGSLIKYIPSGSALENALVERIVLDTLAGKITFETIAEFVQAAASMGRLRVIQATEVWGGKVGRVQPDFKVYAPTQSLDIAPVIVQQPAFGPINDSLEQAVKEVRARVNQTSEPVFGVILKHKTRPIFVASEPVTGDMDFSLSKIFPPTATHPLPMPEQYQVASFYCSDGFYRDPSLMPAQQPSLFKHFVAPGTLVRGINAAQAFAGASRGRAVPLFICTRDGAVLRYVSRFATAETAFSAYLPKSEGPGLAIERELLGGMTTTLAYIRHVASAGELSVLHTSDLWSRSGRVKPTWEPYQGFSRRALGPSFLSADDAARDAHEKIARRDDKVYGGLIYQRLDNRFVATEPLACHNETFDPTCVIPPELIALTPHGCSVVAVYHTHRVHPLQLWRTAAEEQLFQTMLEPHELNAAIRDREWAPSRYFSARDGTLLKYTPSDSVSEHLLRKQIAAPVEHPEQVRKNAINMAMRANALKPSEYIRRVARAGDLQVVVGSTLWGTAGQVTSDFTPNARPAPSGGTIRQPALGPVFSQLQDAMRYTHERMVHGEAAQYGLILGNPHSNEYVATLPVPDEPFTLNRLFPLDGLDGQFNLPPGFTFQGVYVAAPKMPPQVEGMNTRRIYEGFVSPVHMAQGLILSDSIKEQNAVVPATAVLYLSTSDGALLRYLDRSAATQLSTGVFQNGGQTTLNQLMTLKLTPLDYVRRVAMAGDLQVIKTNPLWLNPGRVSPTWRPFGLEVPSAAARSIRLFAMSPVFSHPDDAARYEHLHLKRAQTGSVMGGVLRHRAYDTCVALQSVENGEPVNVAQMILNTHLSIPNLMAAKAILPTGYSINSLHFARVVNGQSAGSPVETNLLKNMFWPVDICYATRTLHRQLNDASLDDLYLTTDDGALLKYTRGSKEANDRLCEYVSGASFTYERYFIENNAPTRTPSNPEDLLTQVLNSGVLQVLEPSATWPRAGAVDTHLTVSTQPLSFDYEGVTPGTPVAQLKVGPVRDEL